MAHPKQKRALALLGGCLRDFPIRHKEWHIIAAADGGAVHALNQGVWPDVVIGDNDSLTPAQRITLEAGGVPRHALPHGDELTDGEGVVRWLIKRGVHRIVLAGALGGAFDHTLGNVMLLYTLAEHGVAGFATDGRQYVHLLQRSVQLQANPGDRLSIVPLTQLVTGVNVAGVKWPLTDATLHRAHTRGISNVVQDKVVTCTATGGAALLIHTPAEPMPIPDE